MLENAGAYVFTPRERDWQWREAIVDNDTPEQGGSYREDNGKYNWETIPAGFAKLKTSYVDGENPFLDGTSKQHLPSTARARPRKYAGRPRYRPMADMQYTYRTRRYLTVYRKLITRYATKVLPPLSRSTNRWAAIHGYIWVHLNSEAEIHDSTTSV